MKQKCTTPLAIIFIFLFSLTSQNVWAVVSAEKIETVQELNENSKDKPTVAKKKKRTGFLTKIKDRIVNQIAKKIEKMAEKDNYKTKKIIILLAVFACLLMGILMLVGSIDFTGSLYVGIGLLAIVASTLIYYAVKNRKSPMD